MSDPKPMPAEDAAGRRGGRAAKRAARRDGAGKGPTTAIWPGVDGGAIGRLRKGAATTGSRCATTRACSRVAKYRCTTTR